MLNNQVYRQYSSITRLFSFFCHCLSTAVAIFYTMYCLRNTFWQLFFELKYFTEKDIVFSKILINILAQFV